MGEKYLENLFKYSNEKIRDFPQMYKIDGFFYLL